MIPQYLNRISFALGTVVSLIGIFLRIDYRLAHINVFLTYAGDEGV